MIPCRPTVSGGAALLLGGMLAALAASPAHAATRWYVDRGSARCDNRGAGTSTTPFCTIQTAAKKAVAGDIVLVRPGIYREEVTPMKSGAPHFPITYQATASGVVVLGSDNVSAPARWHRAAGNSWSQSLLTAPAQVFVDNVRLANAPSADATTTNSFFYDTALKLLYVDIGGPNPGNAHIVEAGARFYAFNVDGMTDIVIDGFAMRNQNLDGVRIANTSSVNARNLDISFTGAYGIHVESCTGQVVAELSTIRNAMSNGILVWNSTGSIVRNNLTQNNGLHGISLQGSSANFVQGNTSSGNADAVIRSATGIDISLGSNDNIVQSNTAYANQDSGIQVYSASNNNLLVRNVSWNNGDHGFDTNQSTGTRYVSNTSFRNYKCGFSVQGGSNGTLLANNISAENGLTSNAYDLFVDPPSVTGFASDYDLMYRPGTTRGVRFNDVFYLTLRDFSLGTNQEIHGLGGNPRFLGPAWGDLRLSSHSPAIDSANMDVFGFMTTDRFGFPLADDPLTPNTGRGGLRIADRGALEFDPPPTAVMTVSSITGRAPLTITADASRSLDTDATPVTTFTFDFRDGRAQSPQQSPVATHTFTQPGIYRVSVTVRDSGGQSSSVTSPVTVQKATADLGFASPVVPGITARE